MTTQQNETSEDFRIILFLKAPIKGAVKTRLAESIGDAAALELYRCFVADVLTMAQSTGLNISVYYYPARAGDQIRSWLGDGFDIFPQTGDNLGEKMKNALAETFFAGFKRAIIIGSDLPDLLPEIIDEAFDRLKENSAVIGPSRDGGYYLIGFTADGFLPEIFDNISWGTDTVLSNTLKRFRDNGIVPIILPVWRDIDTIVDLDNLSLTLKEVPGLAKHTRAYLQQAKIK